MTLNTTVLLLLMFFLVLLSFTTAFSKPKNKASKNELSALDAIIIGNLMKQNHQKSRRQKRQLEKSDILLDEIMNLINKDKELKIRLKARLDLEERTNGDDSLNADFAPFPAQPVGFPRYCCKCQKGKRTIQ